MAKQKKIQKPSSESSEDAVQGAYHLPVLLHESIDALQVRADGVYVDCTFGGGGHSREILKRLGPAGRLLVFDQDADAKQNIPDDKRIVFIQHNFRHLQRFLRLHQASSVDGVLADLGVSSHQFDEPERGFSIRFEGDLDMRMDKRQELTAFDVVNRYPEQQLHKIFEQYGEITNSRSLARKIVQVRTTTSLKTIVNFKYAVSSEVKGNPNRYFAQVFQALRIEVNDEFGALKELLQQIPDVLHAGGRAAIITFHSLEDRIVKNFFKNGTFDDTLSQDPFGNIIQTITLRPVTRKPIEPSPDEMKKNPRSRSARLRVAEKV